MQNPPGLKGPKRSIWMAANCGRSASQCSSVRMVTMLMLLLPAFTSAQSTKYEKDIQVPISADKVLHRLSMLLGLRLSMLRGLRLLLCAATPAGA